MEYQGRSAVLHNGGPCCEQSCDSQGCSSTQTAGPDDMNKEVCCVSDMGVEVCKGPRDPGYYLPDDDAAYKTDEFRMFTHKVDTCPKRFRHDWTSCNFAHPAEKARRRDLEKWEYTGIACPQMKQDRSCKWGRDCPYAHSVFEYWLHPTRYRTQMCRHAKKGNRCPNRICFFAHNNAELRRNVPKPIISHEKLVMIYGPDTDIEKIFSAALQGATPPAKDFGLWRGWSPEIPKREELSTRCPELVGDGFQEPHVLQSGLLGNMQGFNNILQSCMEQQNLQMNSDFLSQMLGNANSRAQPSFLGNAPPRAEPNIFDYLQQSIGLPSSAANTLGGSLVPKFLDPVGTMQRLPPLAVTPPYDDMLSRGGTPMGHDTNPFSSFMPCSPSFIPPTTGLESGYSSYTQGSAQAMMDLDRMSRRSSGVSEDSSATQLRAFLAQQSAYDSPMQLNQFQPDLFDGYGFMNNHADSEGSSAPRNQAPGDTQMSQAYSLWGPGR